ncbi:MAG: dTDP-4-dehydrorhamnose 3,5-epimerase family protein [Flavobacterium sp.]|nr:dTDP-4-dehydrorhamnose 3,5-epimerase family protein [Flavobacterium sp.]
MNILSTDFRDLFVLELLSFKDTRGEFVKTIHAETYTASRLDYNFTESFYSVSNKNVIRGMHFQVPPQDHNKLVYVVKGKIIDVILDLRANEATFGQFYTVELSEVNRKAVYIGKGFAHGFLSLQDDTIVEYHTSTSQNRACEAGLLWSSFGYQWPVETPITSARDAAFESFQNFKSPF